MTLDTKNKLIIVTAPSGAGKTTIVHHLLKTFPQLAFSVSATNRPQRAGEINGKDYYFFDTDAIKQKIAANEFVEYEEVYENRFYGTLRAEVQKLWLEDKCIVFDVDVRGALNLKKQFGTQALAIFIEPPSAAVLMQRLRRRNTETEQTLQMRIAKAAEELTFADAFDVKILNDTLEHALEEAGNITKKFLNNRFHSKK